MKFGSAQFSLLALLLGASSLEAQQTVPLVVGGVHADSLASDEVGVFTIELPPEQFVLGAVDQHTMDVVISVHGPNGPVQRFDESARGRDPFQFDADAAGTYRIEISPFERQSGRYSIALRRVEPIAEEPSERVDQIMSAYAAPDVPGGLVGVVRDGELAFAGAYGSANLTHRIPFEVDTRTNIGSTSKQFTAFAIALLAQRGRLSLDDDVREHIPELPDLGATVTLRHLLSHTSGYREFLNTLALGGAPPGRRRLRRTFGNHRGRAAPAGAAERAGRGVELQQHGLRTAGRNRRARHGRVVPRMDARERVPAAADGADGRARGSVADRPQQCPGLRACGRGCWRDAEDLGGAMGAGGIYTSLDDLAQWIDNFDDGSLGADDVFDRMTRRFVLADGDTTEYGMGMFVDEYRGLRRVHHGGADVAHRSMLVYFPALDAGVITLSNNATFNAVSVANQVADLFFGEHMEPKEQGAATDAPETFDVADFDAESFDGLAGRYALVEAPTFIVSFSRDGDTFYTQATGQPQLQIVPTSDSTFRLLTVPASVTFHRGPGGRADSLTLHQNGDHLARRIDGTVQDPSAIDLDEYTGEFYSPELRTRYEIVLEEGELVLHHRRFEEGIPLDPGATRDLFTGGFPVAQVRFLRDEAGVVIGLEVSNGRTRGVHFDRVTASAR